ncbi:ROK family transcriptional regulator [Desmospora activa]|uniref:ROK family transcriptional regulator n=1 Tax=Desmospora activa TaxID=500615 RepID=UPI001FEAFC31|nr:ROK family transcriptional regulator [Desmospora activa]
MNRTRVLDVIRRFGPIAKMEVAAKTGLTFAAVANIVKDLESAGMIVSKGEGESTGGRKPVLFEMNEEACYVVAVDFSVEDIQMAIMDLATRECAKIHTSAPVDGEPDSYIEIIVTGVRQMMAEAGIDEQKILGMGVSSPGPVFPTTGQIFYPPNLPRWKEVPLKERLEAALGLPVKVEKDANLAAMGEKWFGAGRKAENLIYVLVGEGLGAGVIIDGSLYHGQEFGAGEIGHITVDRNGPKCNCGNDGCLEAMASGIAMVREVRAKLRQGEQSSFFHQGEVTFPHFMEALSKREPLARSVADEASRVLGIGVAGVINAFHPQKLLIGGKVPEVYPQMVEIAAQIAQKRVVSVFRDRLNICTGELKGRSSLVGAAASVMEGMFTLRIR